MKILHFLLQALLLAGVTQAYIQDYQWQTINNVDTFYWRRTVADTPTRVIIPNTPVTLYYNCFYMPAIYQNYRNWIITARARTRVLATTPTYGLNFYGYDLWTNARDVRGRDMCPDNWKTNHRCPEQDVNGIVIQPNVMPGPWSTTDGETIDPLHVNEIAGLYGTPDQTQRLVKGRC
ncbi:hypothetical protein BDW02DRAFT_575109 [Decorospora gaudefroyi]|uniref:Uncharacterized protein n=1 Tax=Decorospora gaudefroyi TaxID=184978 RepID=A0A6A5K1S7_9PLEO|nr:hypothetical protein BDW02DRAFT_575109 [Decorospora gaudefroyi]